MSPEITDKIMVCTHTHILCLENDSTLFIRLSKRSMTHPKGRNVDPMKKDSFDVNSKKKFIC